MPEKHKPARRPGRPRDDRIDTAILSATLEELAIAGYQGMSMNSIAARAGVSKPTIYRRWPNKPALAIAAIVELVTKEELEPTGDTVVDLARQLQAAHDNLKRASSVTLLGAILAEQEREPSFIETYRERLLNPRRAALERILAAAQERKEIRSDVDLRQASLALMGLLYGGYMAGEEMNGGWLEPEVRLVVEGLSGAGTARRRARS